MIKKIDRNDISDCVNVIKESFLTIASNFNITIQNAPRFTAFATSEERLNWHYDNEHRQMYAYYINKKIIGYYSLAILEDRVCELNNLCVLPEYRHNRIGEELLQHAFIQATDMECIKIIISIVEENKMLRRWYESYGFNHTETKKFDFFPFTCGYMERYL